MKLSQVVPELETEEVWDQRIYGKDWDANRWVMRQEHCIEKGWFILTKESAQELYRFLNRFDRIVEPFAGTGYLAHHMRKMGLGRRYRAYDACVSHWDNDKRPRRNYGFTKSGCFNINLKKADAVVMTWPNYAENLAYRIVRKMVPGQYLVYQGESQGGCTGDDQFHQYLEENFTPLIVWSKKINHRHVKWYGMYDSWNVYVKKESV